MDLVYSIWRIGNWSYYHKLRPISYMVRVCIRIFLSADVPPQMQIGSGTRFPHTAQGCIFHPKSIIGRNCVILHNVTLGGRNGKPDLPIVGDNVYIGAGAIIMGGVEIGDNSIIGAGSIVTKNVPKNAIVCGNPAKILRYKS